MSAPSPQLSRLERAWFVALVVGQVGYALVLPALNSPDERAHYIRMWSLSEGHFSCQTIPSTVRSTQAMERVGPRESMGRYFARGLAIPTDDTPVNGWDYLCPYFPVGLAPQALANRLVAKRFDGHLRPGGVFAGIYAARLTSAAAVDTALYLLLRALPWGRAAALAFFSIPLVVQEAQSIGHDPFLLVCTMLILIAALGPPSWRAVGVIVGGATAMALVKPVYAPFALLALPVLVKQNDAGRPLGWRWLAAATTLTPLAVYPLWRALSADSNRFWKPGFADPTRQFHHLRQHPLTAFKVLASYGHYFIDDHKLPDFDPRLINGKWTTLLFGNAHFEMALAGDLCVVGGLLLALLAVVWRARREAQAVETPAVEAPPAETAPGEMPWRLRLAWAAATAGVLLVIPLVVFALYMVFSPVGLGQPNGVQGRYHIFTLLVLLFLVTCALRRIVRPRALWAAWAVRGSAALFFVGYGFAISAVYRYYWPR